MDFENVLHPNNPFTFISVYIFEGFLLVTDEKGKISANICFSDAQF